MTTTAKVAGILLGAALCTLVIAGSRVPWTPVPDGSAAIRLSWRAVLPVVEECREPTADEVAHLPSHMRPAEICTGSPITFRLLFLLDGAVLLDELLVPGGSRSQRPVHVYHEFRVAPGTHRIEVELGPENAEVATAAGATTTSLDETVRLDPLDIVLITRVDGALVIRQSGLEAAPTRF